MLKANIGRMIGAAALLCLSLMPTIAQNAPQNTPPPTGYEDLIAAGKLAAACKPLQEAVQPTATLQQKRLATIDPKMDEALRTLRAWLNRPDRVVQPGALSDLPLETLGQVRMLARALMVEQYVFLASGRVGAAIDSARDGLRMSYAIKPNSLITWLTGNAVDAVVTQTVVKHLDQLSQKDCESLAALAKDWMAAPDPTAGMLDAERKQVVGRLKAQIAQTLAAPDALKPPADAALPPEYKNLSKANVEMLWQQVLAKLDQMYVAFQADLNKPLWERMQDLPEPAAPDGKQPMADQIAAALIAINQPALEQMLEARGKQQARAELVGCHAAICSYRWEHDQLPKSLDELKLGDMASDPFTGQPFIYKPTADRRSYVLQSAGPPVRDEKNHIKPGERKPFALTP
jgi:hypothetical protein